ncbi:MAG: glycosyltransferase family 39 protein [Candidatus Sumerlaeota bacterium]|nr:glycosyltransferase family 39 protein [Candidatus Sumerlaeota bacterium]
MQPGLAKAGLNALRRNRPVTYPEKIEINMRRRKSRSRPHAREDARSAVPRTPYENPIPRGVWLITALAFLLRVPDLGRNGLWLDEVYVHNDTLRPFWHNLQFGSFHFVHFLILKPFLFLHDSPFFLRLPSALSGVLAVPLMYLAVRRLLGGGVAGGAALLLAVSPFAVHYSHDANYYSNEILLCVCALYFLLRFRSTHSWLNVLFMALCSGLVFFVHPVVAIFLACLWGSWGLTLIETPALRRSMLEAPARVRRSARSAVVGAVGIIAMGVGAYWLGPRMFHILLNFLHGISPGSTPFGVERSYAFVFGYFRQFGPAFGVENAWASALTYLCFGLFAMGCASSVRRGWGIGALLCLPFIASFILVFNIKFARYFHIRYFSYLVPLYLIGIAEGIHFIAHVCNARIALGKRLSPEILTRWGAFSLAAAMTPQLWSFFAVHGGNWDDAFRIARERADTRSVFAYTNFAEEEMADYTFPRFGFDPHQGRRLGEPSRQSGLFTHLFKEWAFRYPDVWWIHSWTTINPGPILNWARKNMELVCDAPSALEPVNEIELYHWPYAGRFVLSRKVMTYMPAQEVTLREPGWSETIYFDQASSYVLGLRLNRPPQGSWRLALQVDGQEVCAAKGEGGGTAEASVGPFAAEAGPRKLHLLASEGAASDAPPLSMKEARIAASQGEAGFHIGAWDVEDFYPSEWVWSRMVQGSDALVLKRKTFAQYSFDLERAADYEIGIEALNDQPGPVLLECAIDGEPQGILAYARNDNSWEEQKFPAPLAEGRHRLALSFLNENESVSASLPPEKDRNAVIRDIAIRPRKAAEAVQDDRMATPSRLSRMIPLTAAPNAKSLAPGWQVAPMKPYEPVRGPDGQGVAIRFTMQRDDRAVFLASPPQPVPPNGIVYYSAMVRAQDLKNHSANLMTVFAGESGKPLENGSKWVNAEGITGTTDWVRIVEFIKAPSAARHFLAAFSSYPNSNRSYLRTGYVDFADLRIHEVSMAADKAGQKQ